ncbi:hypothetical protein DPEC_G00028180 [Dallia pectoralis]|uniref:Uncharacterized protein n=1 Tax=Dallia pectoralis TaxID=75939 RepID=A0ACC2HJH3_DALPE|nr:hypothetical protein DPEC_G00028180 [Dallia pectoralis]
MFGKWIFLEGFSDNEILNEILRMTKSSWNSILPTSHNETILLKQGNLMDGKCFNSSLKMTYSKNRFLVTENNVTSSGYLLQTCPDCLTMQFTTTMTSVNFRSLYIFGKNKTPPESDLKYFRKQAECLQYPEPAQYSYNGVSELCSEPADGLQHPECSVTLSWWLDS